MVMIMRTGRTTLDKKDSDIKLRINDDTRRFIEVMADKYDMSMSEYIRMLITREMNNVKSC